MRQIGTQSHFVLGCSSHNTHAPPIFPGLTALSSLARGLQNY